MLSTHLLDTVQRWSWMLSPCLADMEKSHWQGLHIADHHLRASTPTVSPSTESLLFDKQSPKTVSGHLMYSPTQEPLQVPAPLWKMEVSHLVKKCCGPKAILFP